MPIKNEDELRETMKQVMNEVFLKVENKVSKYLRYNILRYTYLAKNESSAKNKWYWNNSKKPTFEFLNAWDWEGIKFTSGIITDTLFYNWEKMDFDAKTWKHGSPIKGWPEDVREGLAQILNVEGAYSSHPMTKNRHAFWDLTLKEFFEGGLLEKWFTEELTNQGLIIKKG